jgi:hypothetical protein
MFIGRHRFSFRFALSPDREHDITSFDILKVPPLLLAPLKFQGPKPIYRSEVGFELGLRVIYLLAQGAGRTVAHRP